MPAPFRAAAKVSALKGMSADDYVAKKLNAEQTAIVNELRALVRKAAPKSGESIKWAMVVYEENGPFAYIKSYKQHVTFGFWRGAELSDPKGMLAGDSERMKHVQLASVKAIRKKEFQAFVKEAVQLNHAKGDPTKRQNR